LGRRTKLLAQQLAVSTLDQLARHWSNASAIPVDSLYDEVISDPARWADLAIVATALESCMEILPRRQAQAEALLEMISRAAMEIDRIAQPAAEAGRLVALLIATRSLSDQVAYNAFLDGWSTYARGQYGDTTAESSSLRSRPDWSLSPRELSARIALLSEVVRSVPDQRDIALRAITQHIAQDIIAARVQLVDPRGMWLVHSRAGCLGFAPVFARVYGPLWLAP